MQSVASILGISLDAVVNLAQRGRIKANRRSTHLQVDVLSPYDEYEIDYDSAYDYHSKLLKEREKEKSSAADMSASSELKIPEMTRRGSR